MKKNVRYVCTSKRTTCTKYHANTTIYDNWKNMSSWLSSWIFNENKNRVKSLVTCNQNVRYVCTSKRTTCTKYHANTTIYDNWKNMSSWLSSWIFNENKNRVKSLVTCNRMYTNSLHNIKTNYFFLFDGQDTLLN